MDTLVIKSRIIERIAQIEDPTFLKAIQTIVESNQSETVFTVPKFLKDEINIGRCQIENREYIDNAGLEKEIEAWLSEKK